MADKTRSFSIFLLKAGFDSTNSLEGDHKLESDFSASQLPEGSELFILDGQSRAPWWSGFFGVVEPLQQSTKGALIFIPAKDRVFSLCFGHVQHNLKDVAFVHDFGLKVTLNSVDPKKLRSTDALEPGASRRKRTQLPNEAELTLFDFDHDESVLRSLTGRVKSQYEELFRHPTGSSNLRISTRAQPDGLCELCESLLELYSSDSYLETFPDIRSIEPVKEPELIAELEAQLELEVRARSTEVTLTVPDFLDYSNAAWFGFSGLRASKIYDDVFMERYYSYIEASRTLLADITTTDLKKHKLIVMNSDEVVIKGFSLFRCLVFDVKIAGSNSVYHLSEGSWYKFDDTLVAKLKALLDPYCLDLGLPEYVHIDEGAYNDHVAVAGINCISLDKTNISPNGQKQIEPCDLVRCDAAGIHLIHVKRSTQSSSLSHLFAQGLTSIELLRDEASSVDKLVELASERGGDPDQLRAALNENKIFVEYAIITHKNPARLSDNLPLFSRLSLARAIKSLRRMSVGRQFGFVRDATPTSDGKKRAKAPKAADNLDMDDDQLLEDV